MVPGSKTLLGLTWLVALAAPTTYFARPAYGSDFSAFSDDEGVCSRLGGAAIKGAAGGLAAQRYDAAYRRCMATRMQTRQMQAYRQGGAYGGAYPGGNPHGFEYPDAFYSVPYATPGYGYDGFAY